MSSRTRFRPNLVVAAVAIALGTVIGTMGNVHWTQKSGAAALPTPRAYARVISNGTFDAHRSKNITAINKIGSGFYCIQVAVPVRNVIASGNGVTFNTVAEGGLVGSALDSGLSCPAGSTAYVVTFNGATGALGDRPFYVLFI